MRPRRPSSNNWRFFPWLPPSIVRTGRAARKPDCDLPVETWGHLRLLERLGRGAFGEVYRAWDTRLDREVALKLVSAPAASGRASSIIEEGRLLARVRHPGVVTIHGAEQIGDGIGLWMEFVRGRTLEDLLETGSSFTTAEVIRIGVQLSRAVHAVHAAGLLHRDIKAHNVMRDDDGRVMLMDFGTGRELTDSGSDLTGTPLYLAPEVFAGQPATVQSDVYSLGVLLFRLATGTYPVRGGSVRELRGAHERGERVTVSEVKPKVQPRLGRLIDRMVDPRPAARPPAADTIAAELLRIDRHARIKPLVQATSLVAALLIAGAVTWAWWPFTSAQVPQPPETAQARDEEPMSTDPSSSPPGGLSATPTPPPATATTGRRSRGIRPSIEVLPFTNSTARDVDKWLSLAMAEMLLREFRGSEAFRWIPAAPPLAVAQLGPLSSQSREFIRPSVPADMVVSGEYRVSGQSGQPSGLAVTVKLEDRANGQLAIALSETGSPADIRGLMSRIGSRARAALGAGDLSPAQASALAASQPANAEAARAFAEGLAMPRGEAVEAMERAIAADDRFAPAYAALSEGWMARRDDEKRAAAAARAVELSVQLPREERLLIQLRCLPTGVTLNSETAEKLYHELFLWFPDTLLYGWRTAFSQAQLLQFRESLATIDSIGLVPGASEHVDLLRLEADLAHGTRDYDRARRALDKAAAIAIAVGDRNLIGDVRYKQARLAEEMSDQPQALRLAEEAAEHLGAQRNLIVHDARLMRVAIFRAQGDSARAAMAYDELVARSNDPSRFSTEGDALSYLGYLLADRGYLTESRTVWERVMQDALPMPATMRNPSLALGAVLYQLGDFSAARTNLETALAEIPNRRPSNRNNRETGVRTELARLLIASGEPAAAREHALRSVEVAVDAEESVEALNTLARTFLAAGETAAARKAIDESASLRVIQQPFLYVASDRDIVQSLVALEEGRLRESRSYAERATLNARYGLHIRYRGGRPDDQAAAEIVLALALLAEGNLAEAERAIARVQPRLQITQDRLLRLSAGVAAARVRAAKAAPASVAQAKRELDAIVLEAANLGAVAIAFDARLALGEIEMRIGDLASGRVRLAALQRDAMAKGFHSIARKAAATIK